MKLNTFGCLAALSATLLSGCVTPEGNPDRTGTGALAGGLIGATSGALIGGGRGRGGEGALIGGAIGAITGGLIGHSMDQEEEARLRAQAPQTYARVEQGQPLSLADVKAMAKSGINDDVIISQIRNTHTAYRLTATDIIDLHDSGVSQKVIDFMINTPNLAAAAAAPAQSDAVVVTEAPPPMPAETIIAAPGPGYVWVSGEWVWRGRWVWAGGHWIVPPRRDVVWVRATWVRSPRGWRYAPGHWR